MRAVNGRRAAIAGGYGLLTRVVGAVVSAPRRLPGVVVHAVRAWVQLLAGVSERQLAVFDHALLHRPVIEQVLFPAVDPAIANVLPVFYVPLSKS
jgi:hypothetical protein